MELISHLWATSNFVPRFEALGTPRQQGLGLGQRCHTADLWATSAVVPCSEAPGAHNLANWLHNPCRPGGPRRFIEATAPKMGRLATEPVPSWGSQTLHIQMRIRQWPRNGQIGYITPAVSGSPTLQRGGQNHKGPGHGGHITSPTKGVPNASQRWTKSVMTHNRAYWLHNPCRRGVPNALHRVGGVRNGPQVGLVST